MVNPVLHGALLGDQGLDIVAQDGDHGEPSVLDLLHLQLGERVGVVGEAQGVEWATGVQVVQILPEVTNASA